MGIACGVVFLQADGLGDRIRMIDLATAVVTTLAGSAVGYADGQGTLALFSNPSGISIDDAGTFAVVVRRGGGRGGCGGSTSTLPHSIPFFRVTWTTKLFVASTWRRAS